MLLPLWRMKMKQNHWVELDFIIEEIEEEAVEDLIVEEEEVLEDEVVYEDSKTLFHRIWKK